LLVSAAIHDEIQIVRAHAKEWNIDPGRVGIIGFSAGGHLSTRLSTNYEKPAYPAIDEFDPLSCRPDFTVSWSAAHKHALRWCRNGTWAPILTTGRGRRPRMPSHWMNQLAEEPPSPFA